MAVDVLAQRGVLAVTSANNGTSSKTDLVAHVPSIAAQPRQPGHYQHEPGLCAHVRASVPTQMAGLRVYIRRVTSRVCVAAAPWLPVLLPAKCINAKSPVWRPGCMAGGRV